MKYLLNIYASEAEEDALSPEATGQLMQAYGAYTEALVKAGVLQGGERLRPSKDAASVRVRNGKTEVLNGPYAETREQLGGYYLIDVADLDAALAWAARCPTSSYGTIEVRPVWAM
ncbi:MAG: YciI family protein [Burkholderiaceae bacterium]